MKKKVIGFLMVILLVFPLVSAGVGISWNKESSLVPENTKTCLTYKIYNPWSDDSYAKIRLSEELMEIVESSDAESKFIPAETSSLEAIPVEFCFKTPKIYERDCLLFDTFLCKQECLEDMKVYEGEVEVFEVPNPVEAGGAGGSATAMSVSAPLRVRVQCLPHSTDYSLIYILVAVIAAILLAVSYLKKRKKGKKKK